MYPNGLQDEFGIYSAKKTLFTLSFPCLCRFRSDIRLMRSRLKDLERGFTRMSSKPGTAASASRSVVTDSGSVNTALVSTAQDTAERARQLEQELKHIHSRVLSLESELKYSGGDE